MNLFSTVQAKAYDLFQKSKSIWKRGACYDTYSQQSMSITQLSRYVLGSTKVSTTTSSLKIFTSKCVVQCQYMMLECIWKLKRPYISCLQLPQGKRQCSIQYSTAWSFPELTFFFLFAFRTAYESCVLFH